MRKFVECLIGCGLSGLGFKGSPFTWEARGVWDRLDQAVGNLGWSLLFPEASLVHLPALKSDHKRILLKLSATRGGIFSPHPFRFLTSWLADIPSRGFYLRLRIMITPGATM